MEVLCSWHSSKERSVKSNKKINKRGSTLHRGKLQTWNFFSLGGSLIPFFLYPPHAIDPGPIGPKSPGGSFSPYLGHVPHSWMNSRHQLSPVVFFDILQPLRQTRENFLQENIPREAFLNLEKHFPGGSGWANRGGGPLWAQSTLGQQPRGSMTRVGGQQHGGYMLYGTCVSLSQQIEIILRWGV